MDLLKIALRILEKSLEEKQPENVKSLTNEESEVNKYLIDENLEQPNHIYEFANNEDLEKREVQGGVTTPVEKNACGLTLADLQYAQAFISQNQKDLNEKVEKNQSGHYRKKSTTSENLKNRVDLLNNTKINSTTGVIEPKTETVTTFPVTPPFGSANITTAANLAAKFKEVANNLNTTVVNREKNLETMAWLIQQLAGTSCFNQGGQNELPIFCSKARKKVLIQAKYKQATVFFQNAGDSGICNGSQLEDAEAPSNDPVRNGNSLLWSCNEILSRPLATNIVGNQQRTSQLQNKYNLSQGYPHSLYHRGVCTEGDSSDS